MSANNGVIRIGRKGIKQFAFGEDGAPFDVDVVVVFQQYLIMDNEFRQLSEPDENGLRVIPLAEMPAYHFACVKFVHDLSGSVVTAAEALDFLARLREAYDELVDFFQPKSRKNQGSPDTSEVELRFSEAEN